MATASSTHSYQRIASSLRRRIESGQLAPGARIPSTRALARKWNVALATAAHALSTLVAEGWVRTLPRVGAVVTDTQPKAHANDNERRPASAKHTPSMRARIIDCAIAMADSEGLAALSLRGVAARLATPVTSLYRHVKSKDELLFLMADAALGEESFPEQAPPGWRARLELAARLQWRVLRRHPWLARLMSITRPQPLVQSLFYADWVLGALAGHGLGASERMQLHIVLHGFIQGLAVNLETEAEAVSETGLDDREWMDTQVGKFEALAASGRYPAFAAALGELVDGFDVDMDALFELGLRSLMDGFAQRLTEP